MKEPPKVRASSKIQSKKKAVAVKVMAYEQHASPLLDALIEGDSVHQLMVDSTDYAIFMLDSSGQVASWNKGAQQIKGFSREEIVGQHVSIFYTPADRVGGKPERDLFTAAQEGRFEEEGRRVRKDGSEFWANVVISAVRDRADRLIGFVKVTRDLTDLRAAQERGAANALALKTASDELEGFTYSVSHDLRAPIRQIEGFAKILGEHLGKDLDPQAEQYLLRIQQGAQQMGRLVDDLLHLARIGQQHAKPQRIPLGSLIEEARANVRGEIADRDIDWQVHPLPAVVCDPGLMTIAFTNLLSNAVKYTRPRKKAVIEIGQVLRGGRTVVYVRDNGVGFDMKYADKLFGVFQRLHSAEEFEGTGVGLATVYRIIQKHRGSIWAESAPDQGSTFFFTLGDEGADAGHSTG